MASEHRIKVIVPIPMDAAGVANRAAQLPPEVVVPRFQASIRGGKLGRSVRATAIMT